MLPGFLPLCDRKPGTEEQQFLLGAGCKVMLMLGLHMRRGTAHAGCFHNTQWKKLKPKLLVAKWLGLSATVNIRVRARNKG